MTKEQQHRYTSWRIRIFFSAWILYCGYYLCRRSLSGSPAWTEGTDSFTTLVFAFSLAYVAGQFLAGSVTDRIGGRATGTLGAFLSAVCTLAIVFASSFSGILLLQIGNGLAQGCGYPAVCKMLGSWFTRQERGIVFAWWSTSYSLGGFIATALSTWLVSGKFSDAAGLKQALWIPALFLFFIGALWWKKTRNTPPEQQLPPIEPQADHDSRWTWRSILQTKEIQILASMYFFLKLTRYALLLWLPLYLVQGLKYSERFAGYTASLFELVGFIGMLAAGYASDRLLNHRRYPVGVIMLFSLAFVCLLHPVFSRMGWGATAVSISLMGIFIYGPDVLMTGTAVLEAVPACAHGRAAAYVNGVGSFGQVLSPLIISGFVQRFGWDSLFNLFVSCSLIAGALLALRWNQGAAEPLVPTSAQAASQM